MRRVEKLYDYCLRSKNDTAEDWDKYFKRKLDQYHQNGSTRLDSLGALIYHQDIIRVVKNIIGIKSLQKIKVLEMGAGSGATTLLMVEEGARGVITDKSTKALEYAKINSTKIKSKNIKMVEDDLFQSRISDGKFDIVQNYGVLEHFSDTEIARAIEIMKRKCKKGGFLIIGIPNYFSPVENLFFWFKRGKGNERYLNKEKLRFLLKEHGLRDIVTVTSGNVYTHFFFGRLSKYTRFFEIFLGEKLGLGSLHIAAGRVQ